MKKRLLSILLALSMMLTFVPVGTVTAFAAEPVLLKSGDRITNGNTEYYMEGTYTSCIYVSTNDDVTINIVGDVTGDESIDYLLRVSANTLTINNRKNYKFEGEGKCKFAILIGGTVIVNGGTYHINGTDLYGGAFLNYHTNTEGSLTLNDVEISSEGNYAINNRAGLVYINGGHYSSKVSGGYGAIVNQTIDGKIGKIELKNVKVDSNSWALTNGGEVIIDVENGRDSEYKGLDGSVFTFAGGTTTIKNGTFSTEGNNVAVGGRGTLNFEGGTVTAPNGSAIAGYGDTAHIKITGGTIENSKYGIEVRKENPEVILENAGFQKNNTDIYLGDNQYITIDENYKEILTVGCADADAKENRRLTTVSADQKNIRLTSVDDNYIVALHKNDDGTEYQELVKRIGHDVTAKNAVATAEISGEVKTLDDTVQVPENTEVTVKADKAPEGMVFEKWEVSPADVITDETFDLTAETATFKMPGKDVTVTAKYVTPEAPKYDLTVKDGTVKVNGKDAVANANGVYEVAENEEVTVTFDKTTLSDAQVFDQWSIKPDSVLNAVDPKAEIITFKMPAEKVTIEAMTKDATIEDDGPDILGTAAMIGVGVAGTAVLGYQGYMLGTELYLKGALPAWAVIPQNRAELALLLWKDAEQPEPVENVLYEDIDENDTDIQKAACWAVENDLMELLDEDNNPDHFDPAAPVTRLEVIRTWNHAQELKG